MNRLIDQIQSEISEKNILGEINYICITRSGLSELLTDFNEEFKMEYMELNRNPEVSDLQEYLNIPILLRVKNEGKKYQLLTEVR